MTNEEALQTLEVLMRQGDVEEQDGRWRFTDTQDWWDLGEWRVRLQEAARNR